MSAPSTALPPLADCGRRVDGWDLLRGLSALAVTAYHLMTWTGLAHVHVWGSYGVYLFFVLSGASLAYTYAERFANGAFAMLAFLKVRYLRIAPLYLALMVVVLPWKLYKDGATPGLLATYLANAFFVFGLSNPLAHSALVGGWSLGIEAIFYLAFPVVMWSLQRRWLAWTLFALLLLLQAVWVHATVDKPALRLSDWIAYHQVPAFAAYFMGGAMIGLARRRNDGLLRPRRAGRWTSGAAGPLALFAGFGVMVLVNPEEPGRQLVAWRGFLLSALCYLMVMMAGELRLADRWKAAARHLGDATYGLYLIHPVLYFGLALALLPRLGIATPELWPMAGRGAFAALLAMLAFGLALASERHFESPLRRWSKSRA
jgi:peptidoglycan/LPS O-acetylase OafA/YrhL